jgi:hypothetical protein
MVTGRQVQPSIALRPASVIRTFVTSTIVPPAPDPLIHNRHKPAVDQPNNQARSEAPATQQQLRGSVEARDREHR